MIHNIIEFKDLSLSFPHKTCFENFSKLILAGSRIALIGRNGAGKSSLFKIINQELTPTSGEVIISSNITIAYIPQIIEGYDDKSGGQKFNKALSEALAKAPDILLLDEPTNHLDLANRKSLMKMLNHFKGTMIMASHDPELIKTCANILWRIDNGKIEVWHGNYDNYLKHITYARRGIEEKIDELNKHKKEAHFALMKEQKRASKSKQKGQKSIDQKKWPNMVSKTKAMRGEETSGGKKKEINNKREELIEELSSIRLPEIIKPSFSFNTAYKNNKTLISINQGTVGYKEKEIIIKDISLSILFGEKIAIKGANGSGKTTLIKAILNDPEVVRKGEWFIIKESEIGYLDQHYKTLDNSKTVFETIKELRPDLAHSDIRKILNDFLFRKNEEVNALVSNLSGGEKARLTLAQIAVNTPSLLILDEITNNLDLETRQHVIEVLKEYPGAMIVISHDEDFLHAIGIGHSYIIENQTLKRC